MCLLAQKRDQIILDTIWTTRPFGFYNSMGRDKREIIFSFFLNNIGSSNIGVVIEKEME